MLERLPTLRHDDRAGPAPDFREGPCRPLTVYPCHSDCAATLTEAENECGDESVSGGMNASGDASVCSEIT